MQEALRNIAVYVATMLLGWVGLTLKNVEIEQATQGMRLAAIEQQVNKITENQTHEVLSQTADATVYHGGL